MTQENQITTPMSFQDRLKERIRESIGELLTDEDLDNLIRRGIDEVFFQERRVQQDHYPHRIQTYPPLIHEIVQDLLSSQMKAAVERWLQDHEAEVKAAIETVIRDGAGNAMIHSLDNRLQGLFEQFGQSVAINLQQGR